MVKILSLIILLSLFLLPNISSALTVDLNLDYPPFGDFDINEDQNLNQLIAWFYYFIVGVAGLAAFAAIVWGGVQWLTSAGNPTKITDAKDKITSIAHVVVEE